MSPSHLVTQASICRPPSRLARTLAWPAVHVAGISPDWDTATATWSQAQTGSPWQTAGAQGGLDRTDSVDSKLVDYTDIGSWLHFDVTDLVSAGYTSFILYGEHEGVNKAIYFPSSEYWDASKHAKLTIHHD